MEVQGHDEITGDEIDKVHDEAKDHQAEEDFRRYIA